MKHRGWKSLEGDAQVACIDQVFSLVSLPAAILDAEGRVQHFSESFAVKLGLTPESLKEFKFNGLLTPDGVRTFASLAGRKGHLHSCDAPPQTAIEVKCLGETQAYVSLINLGPDKDGFLVQFQCCIADDDPRLRYVMERIDLGVWDYDTRTERFTVSDTWRQIRGLPKGAEINVPNDEWLDKIHPDDRDSLRDLFKGQVAGSTKTMVIQYRHRHTDGHWVWILCRASVMKVDDQGLPLKIVGTDTDISEMKERESELLKLTGKLQLAIEASGMGIFEFDPGASLVHWDDKMLEIYQIKDGKNVRPDYSWESYIHPDDVAKTVVFSDECQRENRDFQMDYRIIRGDGQVRHIRTLARSVAVPGAESKLIGVNMDVSEDYYRTQELERARHQLEHDSRHDALTGLGNRRKSDEETLALFKRIPHDQHYAVMHIDLDHFKRVNDTLGHAAGDYVLEIVARKLSDVIAGQGSTFRVGGDEFMVLLETAPDEEKIKEICATLIRRLSEKTAYHGQDCTIGVSIGYAIGQGPPDNPTDIFTNADTALYAAKRAGRSCFRAYSRGLEAGIGALDSMRQDLIEAMEKGEFICHFQPQFDAKSLQIVGAEALVRWQSPRRGLLTPDKFLPEAIRAGLLPDIDACVFDYVLQKQDQWAQAEIDFPRISINVSKQRLDATDLVTQIREALRPHHLITFELLETAFLDRRDTSTAFTLDALKDLGIFIELDDFGSGHSSITALQATCPDSVKIDRSLVDPIKTNPSQLMTLRSLARIARLEGARVIVEGLETGMQLAAIRELDCDVLQGYALQRPMPEIELLALLARNSKTPRSEAG